MSADIRQEVGYVAYGDLPDSVYAHACEAGIAAIDIETTGLDWETCSICTCQIAVPNAQPLIIVDTDVEPANLLRLMADESILKIFHHAMFDLRFMAYHWRATPKNIACTKIASKILRPNRQSHSLKLLLHDFLGVEIDKSHQRSDWTRKTLSQDQIAYAIADTVHLMPLYETLEAALEMEGILSLYHGCVAHIPTRVLLDLGKYNDVYAY